MHVCVCACMYFYITFRDSVEFLKILFSPEDYYPMYSLAVVGDLKENQVAPILSLQGREQCLATRLKGGNSNFR